MSPSCGKTPTCGVSLSRDRFLKNLVAALPKIVFVLDSFEWQGQHGTRRLLSLPSRGKPRIQREYLLAIDDTPTRASQVPRSCRLMPSATWSIRGQGRLWRICPARPRCRRSNHVCVPEVTGVGYHDGNSHCEFHTQSPRPPLASRRRPKRLDGIMTTAATWRIWSDVGIHWCGNNLGWRKNGFNRARTHGAKMSARGSHKEKWWTLSDG